MISVGFVEKSVADSFAKALFDHDEETFAHVTRVSVLARALGSEVGLSGDPLEELCQAAMLHDVGKLVIPIAILRKSEALTDVELSLIHRHANVGAEIILSVSKDLGHIAEAVRHHHEFFDGCGYPSGTAGKQIPYMSRLLAVVDVYDALTHRRPYRRKRLASRAALEHILTRSGSQFDPEVVSAFAVVVSDLGLIPD